MFDFSPKNITISSGIDQNNKSFSPRNCLKNLISQVKWAFSDLLVKEMAIFCFDQSQWYALIIHISSSSNNQNFCNPENHVSISSKCASRKFCWEYEMSFILFHLVVRIRRRKCKEFISVQIYFLQIFGFVSQMQIDILYQNERCGVRDPVCIVQTENLIKTNIYFYLSDMGCFFIDL